MKKMLHRLVATLCVLALCLTSASALSVEDALRLLEENYVGELPPAAYEATTLDELMDAVGDPYTYYMTAEEYEAFLDSLEGESYVTGIGAGIEYTDNGILLTNILEESGAEEAGLVAGDLIIGVEGTSCVPANESHRAMIIGEEGTYVNITVKHQDGSVQDYRIMRKTITIFNTTVKYEDGVGMVDCDSFGTYTPIYFQSGMADHLDARLWIVDVRNNPGGLASAAVSSVGLYTGGGAKLFYRLSDCSSYYANYNGTNLTNAPVIVLINGYAASASEIFAGDIRAEKAGIVVGSRSYGKGSAQIVLDQDNNPDLFDGDSLKVTVYRFYCSDGNTTDKVGVVPTLYVANEYTLPVAKLLSAEKPARGEYLSLRLNGNDYVLLPDDAKEAGLGDALTELLSALPPDASVALVSDEKIAAITADEALAKYGDEAASRRFTDVANSPYATQINTLGTYGILNGTGDGAFNPSATLTRAELCAMLSQALNVSNKTTGNFADVPEDAWYADDVNAAASLGFVNGVGDRLFDPSGTLTQEQFITVMGRLTRFLNFFADDYALELTDEELAENAVYAVYAPWARASADVLTEYAGNMLYTELSQINPQAPVTREQAAATLCNILKTLNIISY